MQFLCNTGETEGGGGRNRKGNGPAFGRALRQNPSYALFSHGRCPARPPRRAPLRIALCLRYNIRIPQSAPMAQWIEQRTSNPSVAGSSPAGRAKGRVLSSEKHHLDSPNQKNLSLYSSISAMQGSIAGFSTTGCPVQPVFPLFESYASGNRLATTSSRTASGASNALPWANIVVSTRSPGR